MKQIEEEKARWLSIFAKSCGYKDASQCPKRQQYFSCKCDVAARIAALTNVIIPDGFQKLTIRDFSGNDQNGVPILSAKVARKAKNQIEKYCWGDIPSERIAVMSREELFKASQLPRRFSEGWNVVIHGGGKAAKTIRRDDSGNTTVRDKPMGKTFMAALLTREAILLQAESKYQTLTYDWINFGSLLHTLKNDPEEATNYWSADWLVIDNISDYHFSASKAQKALVCSLLDPFFYHRAKNKLPTLLVCKFDAADRASELSEVFGDGLNSLVNNSKTVKISLTEDNG